MFSPLCSAYQTKPTNQANPNKKKPNNTTTTQTGQNQLKKGDGMSEGKAAISTHRYRSNQENGLWNRKTGCAALVQRSIHSIKNVKWLTPPYKKRAILWKMGPAKTWNLEHSWEDIPQSFHCIPDLQSFDCSPDMVILLLEIYGQIQKYSEESSQKIQVDIQKLCEERWKIKWVHLPKRDWEAIQYSSNIWEGGKYGIILCIHWKWGWEWWAYTAVNFWSWGKL